MVGPCYELEGKAEQDVELYRTQAISASTSSASSSDVNARVPTPKMVKLETMNPFPASPRRELREACRRWDQPVVSDGMDAAG